MAVDDQYDVTLNVDCHYKITALDEQRMTELSLDPTLVADVKTYLQNCFERTPEIIIGNIMSERHNDLINFPAGTRLTGAEITLTGPI